MTSDATTRMRAEIEEIPAVIERILVESRSDMAGAARAIEAARPGWISIAGRGTSDHAAVYAQYLFETHLGLPTGLAKPSVTTIYDSTLAWRGGLVVAISQSGRSDDLVESARMAKAAGAITVAMVNDTASPLAAASHILLPIGISFWAGPGDEPIVLRVASTYEEATHHRVPPPGLGPVSGHE